MAKKSSSRASKARTTRSWRLLLPSKRPNRLLAALVVSLVIVSGIAVWLQLRAAETVAWPLRTSADRHTLEDQNGKPFLYVADTAWTMLSNLSVSNAQRLIDTRKAQGFSAIQANFLNWNMFQSGPHGAPFVNNNVSQPNATYWAAVDQIINYAKSKNMLLVVGPLTTADNAGRVSASQGTAYGTWLANRYKAQGNLLWYVGHDSDPNNDTATNRAIGAAIKATLPSALISYHSWGGAKPWQVVGGDSWYGYYSFQWNGNDAPLTYQSAAEGYRLSPTRPFLNIEPAYEPSAASGNSRSTSELMVRQNSWWSVLGGAMGAVYGGPQGAWNISDSVNWTNDISRPAATGVGNITKILGGYPAWSKMAPDFNNTAVTAGRGTNGSRDYVTAGRASDGSLIVAYMPTNRAITVNLAQLSGSATARWYDPKSGNVAGTAVSVTNSGSRQFSPPGSNAAGQGDWVLVISTGTSTTVAPTPTPTPTPGTPPATSGTVNDTNFTYSGTWATSDGTGKYQSNDHYSGTTNSAYTYTFTGTQVKLYASKAPHHGRMAVSIDGGAETTVDQYAASRAEQQLLYTSPTLVKGQHTVKVRVTGTKNTASSGFTISADRLDWVSAAAPLKGDLNGDGRVNETDRQILLSNWTG